MLTKIAGTIERIWTLGLKGVQLALDSTGLTADRTVTFPDRDLDLGNPFFDDTTTDGIFSLGTHSELTISGGAVTVTKSYHYIDTEADAATDDLDNLNGASEGAIVQLRSENGSRIVVITENGNIRLAGSSTSFDLDATSVNITLMKRSSNWHEIARAADATKLVDYQYIVGTTSNPQTDATNFADAPTLAEMTASVTVKTGDIVEVDFSGQFENDDKKNDRGAYVGVEFDSVDQAETERGNYVFHDEPEYPGFVTTQWAEVIATGGTFTINIKFWGDDDDTIGKGVQRNLIVRVWR